MKHKPSKILPRLYLLGVMEEEDEIAFEEHIVECPTCCHDLHMHAIQMAANPALWVPFNSRLVHPMSRMPLN